MYCNILHAWWWTQSRMATFLSFKLHTGGSDFKFAVVCLLCLCARLFICALWSPAGKWLTSWLSFVVFNCEFVTLPLVSWVKCGTWLYWFLIFAPLLTLCFSCFRVRILLPRGHLLGKGWPVVGDVYCSFVTLPCGILGQVWYLIVSFPALCRLSYFVLETCKGP